MILTSLVAVSLLGGTADTTILASGKTSLAMQRPEVLLVQNGASIQLVVTARDPLFFNRPVATLYPSADTAGKAIAALPSDSSSVDARSNTNRSTLSFAVTRDQLHAWGVGSRPQVEVGGLVVQLPSGGRKKLKKLFGTTAARPPH